MLKPNRRALVLLAAVFALVSVAPGHAETRPVQLSLFNPAQVFPEKTSIEGVRLNLIYGKNANVSGLDWGLVNHTTGGGTAWQAGGLGMVEGDFIGFQDNIINITGGKFTGVQLGAFNQSGSGHGLAVGWVNVSKNMRGVQLGLVNVTETMHGLQIGLGNVIQKGKMPFLPIVNWSY